MAGLQIVLRKCVEMSRIPVQVNLCRKQSIRIKDWCNKNMDNFNHNSALYVALVSLSDLLPKAFNEVLRGGFGQLQRISRGRYPYQCTT